MPLGGAPYPGPRVRGAWRGVRWTVRTPGGGATCPIGKRFFFSRTGRAVTLDGRDGKLRNGAAKSRANVGRCMPGGRACMQHCARLSCEHTSAPPHNKTLNLEGGRGCFALAVPSAKARSWDGDTFCTIGCWNFGSQESPLPLREHAEKPMLSKEHVENSRLSYVVGYRRVKVEADCRSTTGRQRQEAWTVVARRSLSCFLTSDTLRRSQGQVESRIHAVLKPAQEGGKNRVEAPATFRSSFVLVMTALLPVGGIWQ